VEKIQHCSFFVGTEPVMTDDVAPLRFATPLSSRARLIAAMIQRMRSFVR
jgi:hypothetical protein